MKNVKPWCHEAFLMWYAFQMAHHPICPPFKSFQFLSPTPTNRRNLACPDSAGSNHSIDMNHTTFMSSRLEISFSASFLTQWNCGHSEPLDVVLFVLFILHSAYQLRFPQLVLGIISIHNGKGHGDHIFLTFLFNTWRKWDSDKLKGLSEPSEHINSETWTKASRLHSHCAGVVNVGPSS